MQHPIRMGSRTRQTQEESLTLQLIDAAQTLILLVLNQTRRLCATGLKCLPDADHIPRPYLPALFFIQHTVIRPIYLIKDISAADAPGAPNVYELLGKTFTFDCHLIEFLIICRRLVEVVASQWSSVWFSGKANLGCRNGDVEQKSGFADNSQRGVIR